MDERDAGIGGRAMRIALVALCAIGLLFVAGVMTGLVAGQVQHGGPVSAKVAAIMATCVVLVLLLGWGGWRAARSLSAASGGLNRRERLGRAVIWACAAVGGALGVLIAVAGRNEAGGIFSGAPLQAAIAIGVAVILLVILPALSIYWHRRVVDEQEAQAYAKGVMWAFYAYYIGAPAWWFLWRGGLVAAPDGVAIYLIVTAIALIGWFWNKYR